MSLEGAQTVLAGHLSWGWSSAWGLGAPVRVVVQGSVERNSELDLDMPTRHPHLFDEDPEKSLPASEVKEVDTLSNSMDEIGDALAKPVVNRKIVALRDKSLQSLGELDPPGEALAGPPTEVGHLDEAGLVEVGESATLGLSSGDLALQACEFCGEELVIGNRLSRGNDSLTHEHQLRREQRSAYLLEYERVQCVGADVALGTALFLTTCF
jgi:hypothetical protein